MIDALNKDGRDADRRAAALKELEPYCDGDAVQWTPKSELRVRMASPASAAGYFFYDIQAAERAATALAGVGRIDAKPATLNNDYYLVFSGEGAANVARALRDEARKNFVGSASIPEGRRK